MSEQPHGEADPRLLQRFLDTRGEDRRQLAHLEKATERLTSEVNGLSEALMTYQRQVTADVANRPTHDEAKVQHEKILRDLVRLRLRIRRRGNILFAISLVLLLLACGIGTYVLHQQADNRHQACVTRDNGARAALPFYDHQIALLKDHRVDPAIVGVLQAARASAQNSIVKC